MRIFLLCGFITVLSFAAPAQIREEALEKFKELKSRAQALEKTILSPDKNDIEAATRENVEVFRLLPREVYDVGILNVRGGAFYSFTNKSHSYDLIPQISLQGERLGVGFYGASYGFLTDLGEVPLAKVNLDNQRINFLASYQPPIDESKARIEQARARGFEVDGVVYQSILPPIAGHSYAARAISYNEADVLVAFNIYRKDNDGSLIIFWKMLKEFEKPLLARK